MTNLLVKMSCNKLNRPCEFRIKLKCLEDDWRRGEERRAEERRKGEEKRGKEERRGKGVVGEERRALPAAWLWLAHRGWRNS